MSDDNDIRHGRHCVFLMHVHLVFVTKYRREVFTKEILDDMRGIFASVCADFEAELVEFDGEDDHIHLLVNYPPKVAVSALVNSLKGVSSRMIRKKCYPSIRKNAVGRRTLVAVLLRRKLRRCAHRNHPPIHRAATDATLNGKSKDGYAVRAILPRPEGQGLPRTGSRKVDSCNSRAHVACNASKISACHRHETRSKHA
jgi:putative transposase